MGECAFLGDAASPPMDVGEVDQSLHPAKPASIPAMNQPLPLVTVPTSPVTVSAKPASILAVNQPLLTKLTSSATVSAKPILPAQSHPLVRPLPQAPLAPVTKTHRNGSSWHANPPCQWQTWGSWLPAMSRLGGLDYEVHHYWTASRLSALASNQLAQDDPGPAKFRPSGSGWHGVLAVWTPRVFPWTFTTNPSWGLKLLGLSRQCIPEPGTAFPRQVGPSMLLWGTCTLYICQTTLTWCQPGAASCLPPAVTSWCRSMRRSLCCPISGTRCWKSLSMIHASLPCELPPAALSWGLVEWRGDRMVALHDHSPGPDPPCCRYYHLPSHEAWLSREVTVWWLRALHFSWLDCHAVATSCHLVEWRGDRMVAPILSIS